ncbi:L-dopachrome tautomerase-related protein [Algisphaera agarilytica]|uniref:Sugar lactone lactonase YvrE n=1 Tax=Algisphaera agarilytica TaxID=1385975 RepID=A0A7X0LN74_9BACT|nr:L-dopachrome tautomerase-related protein [Algisphaera agarilytica]MBB6431733.1 sugar lactone lactonase YvrE [Algisphaera agarilytica]
MNKMSILVLSLAGLGVTGCSTTAPHSDEVSAAGDQPAGITFPAGTDLNQLVVELAQFDDHSPSGIAVSSTGRVFVTFPWLDRQPSPALGELQPTGEAVAYPSAIWNQWDAKPGPSALRAIVSAQALTTTIENGNEFLWVLDSGNPRQRGVIVAGPKLFKIDLSDDSVAQIFYFDHQRDFSADSVLSDVRVDAEQGVAYLSDSQRGGIYVVDLKQRQTRAVLVGHESTRPESGVTLHTGPEGERSNVRLGVAGLELSADGDYLYYHAVVGRTLYRVPTAVLLDDQAGEVAVSEAVENLGTTGSAMDGLKFNHATGDLYMTALEHNAVYVRRASGKMESLVADGRLRWPDSLALANDGYLYLTASAKHLKRPYANRSSKDASGYVLKVSLEYLELAAVAAREAEEAQQAYEASKALAEEANQRVEAARQTAEAEAKVAESALREVSAAAEQVTKRQFEVAQAEQAAADQLKVEEAAAMQAQQDAQAAADEAVTSEAVAHEAEEAARLARIKAEEAHRALLKAQEASQTAEQSLAEAEAAEQALEAAVAQAETAQAMALEARESADRLQDAAEAYQARAQVAADAWTTEQGYAQEFAAAAERAERLADIAARSLEQAQLAEVRRSEESDNAGERLELADVPTAE